MENPDQLITLIRFQLDQLSSKNHHHEFEDICRHLAKARICSNVIPATGPVAAGGDQGRDFETFRTYLAGSSIGNSSFLGHLSQKPLAFACTTQKDNIRSKIKQDVEKILESGSKIEGIHYFTTTNIPAAQNHSIKSWAQKKYQIPLEIYDGNAISELLSDGEIIWIAEKYLTIPKGLIPSGNQFQNILRIPGSLPPVCNIPFNRNPNFTGREEFLNNLHKTLHSGKHAALTQALTGLGGMGKTQIAIEYAYRFSSEYDLIWWIRAEDSAILASDFSDLGNHIPQDHAIPNDPQLKNKYIHRWLDTHGKWLLIFDNAQIPTDIYNPTQPAVNYLPQSPTGHILITSRNPNWSSLACPLNIQVFLPEEAIEFLKKRIGQINIKDASDLAKELGSLPLALEQAAAFIVETPGMTIQNYLKIFKERHQQLWEKEKPPINYPDTIATTWKISIDHIQKENPDAVELLILCSFFAADDIPMFILKKVVEDDLKYCDMTKCLKKYSLIDTSSEKISVHRLVQLVTIDSLDIDTRNKWNTIAIRLLADTFDFHPDDPKTWAESTILFPHILSAVALAENQKIELELSGKLLGNVGNYFLKFADYNKAKKIDERALKIAEELYGPTHMDVATAANNLGLVLKNLGDFSRAKTYLERSLKINEELFGPEHERVASAANNLGSVLRDLGEYYCAKEQYERSIAIIQKLNRTDFPEVSKSINNLGQIFHDLGDYPNARIQYEQALEIDERMYGPLHPEVGRDLNNIGLLLQDMGKPKEAKIKFERALKIYETIFGPNHPEVAISLNNYGRILQDLDDLSGAKKQLERSLNIYENLFGPEYFEIARGANNLGVVLMDMGDFSGAKKQLERALAIDEKSYGKDHIEVATDLNNLGSYYTHLGDFSNAKKHYERALTIGETVHGSNHPHVATTIQNIGNVNFLLGEFEEARKNFERALKIFQNVHEPDNIEIAKTSSSLAEVCMYLGDFTEAETQLKCAYTIFEKKMGTEHKFTRMVKAQYEFIFSSNFLI
jgi:tetratricopeptide (TPR) repeat protein